jgi:LuxR family maltose regulon positive regulatory protein
MPDTVTRLPRLAARLVPRPALIRRLDRMSAVTVVEGLPGSGKTTILGQWARHVQASGRQVAWIDSARTGPGELVSLLSRTTEIGVDDGELLVVIDEIDLDDGRDTMSAVLDVLEADERLHLAVSTSLAQSVSSDARNRGLDVNVLSSGDLAATPQQLPTFAEAWGHDLDPQRAEVLHAETGGWLRPSQLVLDATAHDAAALSLGPARRFIEQRVSPHVRAAPREVEVAVGLATAPVVTRDLAETVVDALGHGDADVSSTVVDRFVALGLLTPHRVGGAEQAWRFPGLVRQALHDLPSTVTNGPAGHVIHRALARSLARQASDEPGRLAAALDHARRGEDWALLGELWSKHGLSLLATHPKEASVAYGDLPPEAVGTSPALRIAAALMADDPSLDGDAAERMVRRYARVGRSFSTATLDESQPDEVVSVVTATMVGRRMQGRMTEALDVAGWYGDAPRGRTTRRPGASDGPQAWFEMQWGMTHLLAGNVPEAIAVSTEAFDLAYGSDRLGFVSANAAAHVSLAHALLGALPDAERWLEPAMRSAGAGGWVGELARFPAQISAAIVATDRLDAPRAAALVEALADFSPTAEMWPIASVAFARHAIVFGDPSDAVLQMYDARARRRNLVGDSGASERLLDRCLVDLMTAAGELTRAQAVLSASGDGHPGFKVAEARINLAAGRFDKARLIAETAGRSPSTAVRDRVDLLMVQAVSALRQDREDEARIAFGLAHAIVERVGLTSAYAMIDRPDLDRLLALAGVMLHPSVEDALSRVRPPVHADAELVLLTPRELEVVRQMAVRDSVADVAAALNVSVNTIKKQRVSLYAKLGVNDPHSAVMRAQRLGLLESLS